MIKLINKEHFLATDCTVRWFLWRGDSVNEKIGREERQRRYVARVSSLIFHASTWWYVSCTLLFPCIILAVSRESMIHFTQSFDHFEIFFIFSYLRDLIFEIQITFESLENYFKSAFESQEYRFCRIARAIRPQGY